MGRIKIAELKRHDPDVAGMLDDPTSIVHGLDPDRVVFLTGLDDATCEKLVPQLGCHLVIRAADDLKYASGRVLLSFGTSIIVPQDILNRFPGGAYNIHAASPDYPGRDPHHFAVYDGVTRYGATCHIMTRRVDDGPIVDVEWFEVSPSDTPADLLNRANAASLKIIERIAPKLKTGAPLLPIGEKWGPRKTSRADFLKMCDFSGSSPDERERRIRAQFFVK
jgi:hypothetical protein